MSLSTSINPLAPTVPQTGDYSVPNPIHSGGDTETGVTSGYRLAVLAIHVLVLLGCSLIVFPLNHKQLYIGYDGNDNWALIKSQHTWMPAGLCWSATPLQAMGNIFLGSNLHLSPSCKLAMVLGDGEGNPVLIYVIAALETFLAMILLCRMLEIGPNVAFAAAWLMTLLFLPFSAKMLVYPNTYPSPQLIEIFLLWCLAIGSFWQIGTHGWLRSLGYSTLALLFVVWAVGLQPGWAILSLPLGLCWLASLLAGSRLQRIWRLGAMAGIVLILAPTTIPHVLGNYLYSVPSFFTPELQNDRARNWYFVSMLFHQTFSSWVLAGGGILGAAAALFRAVPAIRALAGFVLLSEVCIVSVGYFVLFQGRYIGPSPLYFEFFLWPFEAIFAAMLLVTLFEASSKWLLRYKTVNICHQYGLATLGLPIASLIWLPFSMKHITVVQQYNEETRLVSLLREKIGLTPGKAFRGAVATFTGYQDTPRGAGWFELLGHDFACRARCGNDHRATGLWYHNIPTLFEYSQFMTPTYYGAMSRLLCRPEDKQVRTVIILTRPNFAYLRSIGIRFVITDFLFDNKANDSLHRERDVHLVDTLHVGDKQLHLYEVDDVNIGNYSPTTVQVAATAQEVVAELGRVDFDFHSVALSADPVSEALVASQNVQLSVHKGYVHVKATSAGTSLLLLPMQYSHCLQLESVRTGNKDARLIRVNLMQAGLVFSDTFEGRIRFAYGPLNNPYGRLRDYFEMKSLRLEDLGKASTPVAGNGEVRR